MYPLLVDAGINIVDYWIRTLDKNHSAFSRKIHGAINMFILFSPDKYLHDVYTVKLTNWMFQYNDVQLLTHAQID